MKRTTETVINAVVRDVSWEMADVEAVEGAVRTCGGAFDAVVSTDEVQTEEGWGRTRLVAPIRTITIIVVDGIPWYLPDPVQAFEPFSSIRYIE